MPLRPRLPVALGLASALLSAAPGDASAQQNLAPAESLFDDGRRLLAEGKYAEACDKLEESEKLDAAVGTLLNLGDCWEKMGKIATAWAVFKQATSMAITAKQASREKIATARAAALAPKIPRLTIVVQTPQGGLDVRRDNVPIGPPEWSAAVVVDPGDHTIVASSPGKKPWTKTVTLAADGRTTVVEVPPLEADELAERAPLHPAAPGGVSVEAVNTHDRNVQRAVGITIGSVGAVAMVVAIPLGVRALGLNKDAAGECPTSSTCTEQGQSDSQSAVVSGTASTILLMAGGAVLVGGLVLYFTAPQAKHETKSARRWVPFIGPGSAGVGGTF